MEARFWLCCTSTWPSKMMDWQAYRARCAAAEWGRPSYCLWIPALFVRNKQTHRHLQIYLLCLLDRCSGCIFPMCAGVFVWWQGCWSSPARLLRTWAAGPMKMQQQLAGLLTSYWARLYEFAFCPIAMKVSLMLSLSQRCTQNKLLKKYVHRT